MTKIAIVNKDIGEGNPCFIIAEAGSNHDGKLDQAKELIKVAAECGADAIKFQSFQADKLFSIPETVENLKKLEIEEQWYIELFNCSEENEIMLFFSVFDEESVDLLEKFDNPVYKLASYELMHFPLLDKISKTNKPIIISTGMANSEEVEKSIDYIKSLEINLVSILHCVSNYPTKPEDVNLNSISALKKFGLPIGFSDHTLGIYASIAAVALGAKVIEKHFTINRKLDGPDHSYALEPLELKEMIKGIREVEKMLGTEEIKASDSEINEREWRRAIYAKKDIEEGKTIEKEDIIFLRPSPPESISPSAKNDILGKKTVKFIKKNNFITKDAFK